MSYPSQLNYNTTFSLNLSDVMKQLIDKNIIYSVQYISNEETQIDSDGPQSYWNITLLCIEKIENDYIFHFNYSNEMHSYSYPYFKHAIKFTLFSRKLSDLKNDFIKILNKESGIDIYGFIRMWNEDYCYAFNTGDANLLSELMNLSVKMMDIESAHEIKCKEEYEQSLQDKAKEDYKQKEEYIVKSCIKGRESHSRL
jgi:hypothetical protein